MISDAIALYELIRRIYAERTFIAALFDWEGNRLEGDDRLKVQVHNLREGVWFYSIEPLEDYQFIRIPVNMGGIIESHGTIGEEMNRLAEYFRYIPVPDGRIYGGTRLNVKVNFMVFAYKPSDLLSSGPVPPNR
jgi:hypothetical protein